MSPDFSAPHLGLGIKQCTHLPIRPVCNRKLDQLVLGFFSFLSNNHRGNELCERCWDFSVYLTQNWMQCGVQEEAGWRKMPSEIGPKRQRPSFPNDPYGRGHDLTSGSFSILSPRVTRPAHGILRCPLPGLKGIKPRFALCFIKPSAPACLCLTGFLPNGSSFETQLLWLQ